jgi:hypothetical protein
MPNGLQFKLRYLYIFAIALWLIITAGFGYQFHQHLYSSSQAPKVVNELCQSLLDNMFVSNGIFAFVTFTIAGLIFWQKRTLLYFVFSYLAYTLSTIVNMFTLNDELINYQQHHGIWQGSVPMGQVLYILLLIVIGIIAVFSYLFAKLLGWVRAKMRDRHD